MRHTLFVGAAIAALVSPVAVSAQQITSGIEGSVRDAAGAALPGAEVVVTDTRTGASRTLTANDTGAFRTDGLVTGGPYTIAVTAAGYEGQTIEQAFIDLQGNTSFNFALVEGAGEIVVTGARAQQTQLAIGPGQSFGTEDLQDFPSITRDIRDIIRFDPRVRLDRANEVDRISCLGGNDRSNTFTVDGAIQTDTYGLNGTPFASRNTLPLPFDAIRETSVEFAPYDVQYGQFTGCAINVVTKSGENKFHGSGFYTYTDGSLLGSKIDGEDFPQVSGSEKRFGGTLSGPIIKDRLFFFAGYEQTELGDTQNLGPIGAGFPNEQEFITEAQFNEVSTIVRDVYGIDSGGIARDLTESSKRYFGRLDWYITDGQRLEVSYQRLEEQNTEADGLNTTTATGINSFESEGTVSDYYAGRLYSNWTDNFTTELRVSHAKVQDVQGPVGGGEAQSDNPQPRIVVGIQNGTEQGSFFAGPGFSRTSNELLTEITQAKAKASLTAGNHTLTLGAELNHLYVLNLFGQNTTGTLTFANIADLRAGLLSGGTNTNPNAEAILGGQGAGAYGNFTASGDINDATAIWSRSIYTFYAQDDWQVTPQLSVLGGVRVDWFDGDAPTNNPNFVNRYGFSNSVPFSKFDPVVLPRVGFTYDFENDGFLSRTVIQGGAGIFSGGDPAVYFSNAFQNNGIALGFGSTGTTAAQGGSCGTARINVLQGGQFTGVPQCIRNDAATQAGAGLADTQSVDPNFAQPTVLRANIGLRTRFGVGTGFFDDWSIQLDYIYSRFRNPISLVDLSQVVDTRLGLNGYSIDGRPIYRAIDPSRSGCDAVLLGGGGSPPQYSNVTTQCFGGTRDDELQLTNGRSYDAHTVSAILQKTFPGLLTAGGQTRFNLGYAYNNAKNNRYNNGTTATGNFDGAAVFDLQDVATATAEYETRHNITFGLDFSEKFVGDYATQFGIAFFASEGTPYSFTFNQPTNLTPTATAPFVRFADEQSGAGQLLYVPTGPNDPNVVYQNGTTATQPNAASTRDQLDAYVNADECLSKARGSSISRNTCRNDWYYDLDLRISQELPGPGRLLGVNDKLRVYADFDNFLNILDSAWNIRRSRGTSIPVLSGGVDAQGRYNYYNFNPNDDNDVTTSASLWRIQVGVNYSF
ncbi:TonB-dependent receptor [Sphingomonas qomolangmaensis]|uniref:TonB-dependent receptor n=1 Tax=Sphingomonas qomolangmaensis TaxID=2918765 RepID=A0ABY5L871_9SPHN|nr:TonB-dependent receptor [Sphingomonas qomolangmaensis]UUL83170.1 TonB-dependent receptor [Sphingomonas qomolangmaensis]